jgi:hypothetical protein
MAVRVGSEDDMVEGICSTRGWTVYELQLRTELMDNNLLHRGSVVNWF